MDMRLKSVLGVIAAAMLAAPAWAGQLLDGKRFRGEIVEAGDTRGDADDFVFENGMFVSTACERYGFKAAPYSARIEGDTVHFTVEAASGKAQMRWSGSVRGDALSADAQHLQPGKKPVAYRASGERVQQAAAREAAP